MTLNLIGTLPKPLAVITGAGGGTGRAAARRLGSRYRLVLSARREDAVRGLEEALVEEGYDVALAQTMDVSDRASVEALAAAAAALGPIGTVVHTAGVSPALADWQQILEINVLGTANVLDAFLPYATVGGTVISVASSSAYTLPTTPEVDVILDDPYAEDLAARLEPLLRELDEHKTDQSFATRVYGASKRGVIRLVERRVGQWAERGARILSVSPGAIVTPMLRQEIELNPLAARAAEFTPLRRLGLPMDVAGVIDFLASDQAAFVTGCDIRVDGGIVPARVHAQPSTP